MAHYIDGYPGRKLTIEGKNYLYFGGTSYLGLQKDTEFQNNFIKNIIKYGTNYGASRKSNIRLNVYEKAEEILAELTGCQKALTLSSGYLAGQITAQHFNKPEYKLFYAPNTHSALYNNYNKPFPNFKDLDSAVRKHLNECNNIIPVVFIDSIDFEGCNYPDFEGLNLLPLDKLNLVVDDSHGIGIIGKNGSGVYKTIEKYQAKELLVCCSLGKSFGIQAGAVLGTTQRVNQLAQSSFFGGASPASPSAIATFNDSQLLYNSKRGVLQSNVTLFKKLIKNIDFFSYMPEHPAFTFQNKQFAQYLEEQGFILTNFNYPEESASTMSRVVISSHHTENDITTLCETINNHS